MQAELSIADELSRRSRDLVTIHQLAGRIDKSYSYTYGAVQRMAKAGLITLRNVGHATLCTLVFSHPTVQALLTLAAAEHIDAELQRQIGPSCTVWMVNREVFCLGSQDQFAHIRKHFPKAKLLDQSSASKLMKELDFTQLKIRANAAYFWAVVGEAHA